MKRRNKLPKTIKVGRCAVKINRRNEYGEYVVQTIIGGRIQGGKSGGAFETDVAAARGTAAAEVRRLRKQKACR
jgi:hypothetical protein